MSQQYMKIISHYEACLAQYGDSHRGVDWPNVTDANLRYQIMLDVIRPSNTPVSLLDFGCGVAHLFSYIQQNNIALVNYTGLDISPRFIHFF